MAEIYAHPWWTTLWLAMGCLALFFSIATTISHTKTTTITKTEPEPAKPMRGFH